MTKTKLVEQFPCPECGTWGSITAKFCTKCGLKLPEDKSGFEKRTVVTPDIPSPRLTDLKGPGLDRLEGESDEDWLIRHAEVIKDIVRPKLYYGLRDPDDPSREEEMQRLDEQEKRRLEELTKATEEELIRRRKLQE